MKKFDFRKLRVLIDEAITYDDIERAYELVEQGIEAAEQKELLSERMYFKAQFSIIEEDFSEAIRYLDLTIKYNPNDGAAYNDRALCMIELGKLEGVEKYFDQGIEVEPNFATIHHNKGWFLNKIGHHNQALKSLRRALKLEPKRAVTYENIANCFLELGQVDKAIAAYKKTSALLSAEHKSIREQIKKLIKILKTLQ